MERTYCPPSDEEKRHGRHPKCRQCRHWAMEAANPRPLPDTRHMGGGDMAGLWEYYGGAMVVK